MIDIEIKHRNELSEKELNEINEIRIAEFSNLTKYEYGVLVNEFILWFLLKENDEIKSIGKLITIPLNFDDEYYEILGVQSIASKDKMRGFGKIIMNSILDYLTRTESLAIGFCEKSNSAFYKKSDWNIIESGESKFIFQFGVDDYGSISEDIGDLLWDGNEDHPVIKHLLSNSKDKITAFRKSW
ncbi:MAG: hypothetical protein Q9M91_02315 [Candidatus Dojkabacteria bacterium]|nr:hypothetical protein [Candidatus Dojkabacteria bacterium]